MSRLGILAGQGPLPRLVAEHEAEAGRTPFIVAFRGETDPRTVADLEHVWVDLAAVGRTIRELKQAGCGRLCLIGPIGRPDFKSLRPDLRGMRLLPKVLAAARQGGDDAMLSVVVRDLEAEGFAVVGADELVAALRPGDGVLGRHAPDEAARADIDRGARLLAALGPYDVGQACVVRDGQVLAIEAAEGTARMLARCADLFAADAQTGRRGVLVKLPKPDQERRVDLPMLGPDTVEQAAAAGLAGIALEAGGVLMLEQEKIRASADAAGLFLYGIAAGELPR